MSITLAELAGNWLERCSDYRPSAFWFWNAEMDPDRMSEVIEEMARAQIREVLIHPIHGLTLEYLSDEFFERYRMALSLLKEKRIGVWIYDEFGWPSGNAGGLLLRKYPESKGWILAYDRDEQGSITVAPRQYDRVLDNTMGAPWTCSEAGYLDTLSAEAVGKFMEITYQRYWEKCGDYFNGTILGFFTDEPATMMDPLSERFGVWGVVGLPWTPDFAERFRKRFGYDIEPLYPELVGNNPSRPKQDYWTLVKELHIKAYHGQISRWCHEHGVRYIGHLGEDAPLQQVRFAGSIYQALSCMDIAGIDHLGTTEAADERWADHALIPSITRHCGKKRSYCEAYGIAPLDIRLGGMLRRAEMQGLYGINDIALMGFHQRQDGIRKHMYWPPLFMESPWWSFFPAYRDALTRSVGLAGLGERKARYAILYPQYEMEQTDLLQYDCGGWGPDNPGATMIQLLGEAIYAGKESFDFVFPEILHQAEVQNGRIRFPHAEYQAILAPGDIRFFEEDLTHLERLHRSGARIQRENLEEMTAALRSAVPSWQNRIQIRTDTPNAVRVHRISYPDGELYALRNSSHENVRVEAQSRKQMSLWDPQTGEILRCPEGICAQMHPYDTLYLTLTDSELSATERVEHIPRPIEARWSLTSERPNTARLTNILFRHPEKGWLPAVDCSCFKQGTGRSLSGIPHDFAGYTEIEFAGEFECESVPEPLGILYEGEHLIRLCMNGEDVDLAGSEPLPYWECSCRRVDIRAWTRIGHNRIAGVLKFDAFETSIRNDLVFSFGPMPSCDVFVAGAFRLRDGSLIRDDRGEEPLPLDFGNAGFSEYAGVLRLRANALADPEISARIRGIRLDPLSEDSIELILDNKSLGMRVRTPYEFRVPELSPGEHVLEIRISGTTANLFGNPSPWGITQAAWMLSP